MAWTRTTSCCGKRIRSDHETDLETVLLSADHAPRFARGSWREEDCGLPGTKSVARRPLPRRRGLNVTSVHGARWPCDMIEIRDAPRLESAICRGGAVEICDEGRTT